LSAPNRPPPPPPQPPRRRSGRCRCAGAAGYPVAVSSQDSADTSSEPAGTAVPADPADTADRYDSETRTWVSEAIRKVGADATRSAATPLTVFPTPLGSGVDLYLKDESVPPTGSLKHRLARSLFLYGLCNGWITEGTTIVEASSGSPAVSEAYFAWFLGLPFVAVMPASTSPEKIALIEAQ